MGRAQPLLRLFPTGRVKLRPQTPPFGGRSTRDRFLRISKLGYAARLCVAVVSAYCLDSNCSSSDIIHSTELKLHYVLVHWVG